MDFHAGIIYLMLFFAGGLAGFINTLAGGGSVLVLPVLITLIGMDANVANATNRVAVLVQSISGAHHFRKRNLVEVKGRWHILLSVVIGGLLGTIWAVNISSRMFEIILAFILIGIVLMMIRPPKMKETKRNFPAWVESLIFIAIGFYGGFIQVGVGLILLASLNLIENLDLIRANALKVTIVLFYTVFSVSIFAISGTVMWKYGLVLSVGNYIGAWIGVRSAVRKGEKIIRLILIVSVLLGSLKLLGVIDWLLSLLK